MDIDFSGFVVEPVDEPNLDIHQLAEVFRANLIPCSEAILGDYIIAGRFPFAVGMVGPTGQRRYMIFAARLRVWLRDMLQAEPTWPNLEAC